MFYNMSSKEFDKCLRCGRKLKNPQHRLLGYGPNCYKKVNAGRLRKKSIIGVVQHDCKTREISTR